MIQDRQLYRRAVTKSDFQSGNGVMFLVLNPAPHGAHRSCRLLDRRPQSPKPAFLQGPIAGWSEAQIQMKLTSQGCLADRVDIMRVAAGPVREPSQRGQWDLKSQGAADHWGHWAGSGAE